MSVDFDPVRLGGRRRMQPLVVGVALVLAGLVVAVIKPWEASSDGVAGASPSASAGATLADGSAAPSVPPSRPPARGTVDTEDGIPAVRWTDIAPIVGSHPSAGVLAVTGHVSRFTGAGADVGLAASWVPADAAVDGVGPNPGVRSGDASVLGLGLTFPTGQTPLDVRIWLERAGNELEWVDAVAVAGRAPATAIVFTRPGAGGFIQAFEAGRYRIDELRDGRIDRVNVGIADSTGSIPDPLDWPVTETRLVPAGRSDPSAVRFGVFATVDGFAVALPVAQRQPLGDVGAWDASLATPSADTAAPIVSAFLPRATGLGVMLTSHASVERAVLTRLAPSPLLPIPPVPVPPLGGISESQGRTPFILFESPDDRALEPGVYALTVSWDDAAGSHEGTWHVELRPGPVHG